MLWRVAMIAFHTYRESVRARVLYGLGALALGTAAYSLAVGAFALGEAPRVVSDLGAASISLYAVIVAVCLAAVSLYRELEQKTVFPILTRPLRRTEYLVGKYLGTVLTLVVFVAFDAAAVLLLVSTLAGRAPWEAALVGAASVTTLAIGAYVSPRSTTWLPVPVSLVTLGVAAALATGSPDELRVVLGSSTLALFEVAVVAAIATLFSSFSSPFLSTVFTFGLFLIGRSADTLAKLPTRTFGARVTEIAGAVAKVVPNLQVYVPPRPLLTGESSQTSLGHYLLVAGLQAVGWSAGLLAVSSVIFRRRDFI